MAVRFTYHGSPFAQQIMNQGFRPGGLLSIAPGQVFSSPNAAFASSYGSPVRMVTPTSALSIPSANLNMKTIGSEVIQSPKAATKGMNLASKVGTTYTGPTAQRLMSGATVAGLGAPPSSGLAMRAVGGPFGLAALAGQGIGMGVDAIARAVNTPEEYEAMKEAARVSGGTGYFDFTDEELGITGPTSSEQVVDIDAARAAIERARQIENQQLASENLIAEAPTVFDINTMGDPALNPGSVNVFGLDPFGVNEDLIERGAVAEEGAITDRGRGQIPVDTRVTPEFTRPTMADVAGDIDLNLTDLGNPLNDPRVVSEEMGMVGFPGLGQVDRGFQDVLDAREARATQIANQQNPNYGQFFRDAPITDTTSGVDFGTILSLGGLLTGNVPLKAAGLIANRDKIGRMAGNVRDRVSSGLGSLNRKMRGVNPDGTTRTQRQYEAAREQRRKDRRVEKMLERKAAGKSYSQKKLNELTTGGSKPGTYTAKGAGSGGSTSSNKVVCTMMNERYGFGSFRNKIWMKFHESYGPEYQKGYHAIFLPLVKIAKGEGKINTAVRKVLEHMGRHVTADMFKIMKGKKRDPLGRIYRAIFEPTCRIIGKIKSALGRG